MGRTARAGIIILVRTYYSTILSPGRGGKAVTMVTQHDISRVKNIEERIGEYVYVGVVLVLSPWLQVVSCPSMSMVSARVIC